MRSCCRLGRRLEHKNRRSDNFDVPTPRKKRHGSRNISATIAPAVHVARFASKYYEFRNLVLRSSWQSSLRVLRRLVDFDWMQIFAFLFSLISKSEGKGEYYSGSTSVCIFLQYIFYHIFITLICKYSYFKRFFFFSEVWGT